MLPLPRKGVVWEGPSCSYISDTYLVCLSLPKRQLLKQRTVAFGQAAGIRKSLELAKGGRAREFVFRSYMVMGII